MFCLNLCAILKAVKLKPRFCDAYNNLASAYMQLGQTKEAIETYQVQGNIKASLKQLFCGPFPLEYVLQSRLYSPVVVYASLRYCSVAVLPSIQMALVLNRGLVDAHSNLGNLYKVRQDCLSV